MNMKKTLALVLALTMTLCAAGAMAAAGHKSHGACGFGSSGCHSQHASGDTTSKGWEVFTEDMTQQYQATGFYLADDLTLKNPVTISTGKTVYLCLNGHTLTADFEGSAFIVKGMLVLCDCSEDGSGKITHADKKTGVGAEVTGTLHMYGGAISGNTGNNANGGGVRLTGGDMFLYGGAVSGNVSTSYGGGVYVDRSSKLTVYGGEISRNEAFSGGGVYSTSAGKIDIQGGEITNNTARNGGGVNPGQMTMSGGTISGNTADGGGISVNGGTLKLSGSAVVMGNKKTDGSASNVSIGTKATFYCSGALTGDNCIGVSKEGELPLTYMRGTSTYQLREEDLNATFYDADPSAGKEINDDGIAQFCQEPEEDPVKQAAIPTAKTDLVYDGSQKVGVEDGEGYCVSGDSSATEAGTYTATVTPDEGYQWSDGSSDPVTITWSIEPAAPALGDVTGPESVTEGAAPEEIEKLLSHSGSTPGTLTLSGNPDFSKPGTFEYEWTFTPTDAKNYTTAKGKITIIVQPASNDGEEGEPPVAAGAAASMPQTGDPSALGAWIALLGACGAAMKLRKK